jgi:hypothetical protein
VGAASGLADAANLFNQTINKEKSMLLLPVVATVPMFAAAGYSLIYLLLGGGLGGAILIFIVAKMLGK